MQSHQSYEERAVLFLIWCFVLIPVCFIVSLRTGGWLSAVLFTLPHVIGAVLLWHFQLRKARRMLKDGEYYPGTVIACCSDFVLQKYCMIEVEFFAEGRRYTTVQYARGCSPREHLASADCVVCRYEEKGVSRCTVRELQYHKPWYAVGIDVPEKAYEELYPKLGIACSDGVPPERAGHILNMVTPDYNALYQAGKNGEKPE